MLPWIKLASDVHTHPRIMAAGRDARELFIFVLCKNGSLALDGLIPAHHLKPEYASVFLGMSVTECHAASRALVTHGLMTEDENGDFCIVGWDEEWRPPKSDAERAANYRKRRKEKAEVTKRHETSRDESDASRPSRIREDKIKIRTDKTTPPTPPRGEARRVAGKFVEYFNRDFDRQFKGEHYVEDVRKVLKKKYKEHQLYAVIWYANTAWEKDEVRANVSPSTLLRLSAPRGKSSDSCFGGYFRAAEELWPRLNANEEPFWRKEADNG